VRQPQESGLGNPDSGKGGQRHPRFTGAGRGDE
jgi:hypothetical protein